MISTYRNRGILQLSFAVVLTVVLTIMGYTWGRRMKDTQIAILILLYLAAVTMWMVGGFSLAKAKGYDGDMVGGVFVFLYIAGFCFPLVPFIFPGVVIFGLKDKTRHRHRSHRW